MDQGEELNLGSCEVYSIKLRDMQSLGLDMAIVHDSCDGSAITPSESRERKIDVM